MKKLKTWDLTCEEVWFILLYNFPYIYIYILNNDNTGMKQFRGAMCNFYTNNNIKASFSQMELFFHSMKLILASCSKKLSQPYNVGEIETMAVCNGSIFYTGDWH